METGLGKVVQSGTDDILNYDGGIGKQGMRTRGVVEVKSVGLANSFKTIGEPSWHGSLVEC